LARGVAVDDVLELVVVVVAVVVVEVDAVLVPVDDVVLLDDAVSTTAHE